MTQNLQFLQAVKRIDAAVLFEFLFSVILEGEPGTVETTTFERLAERLNGYGLRTSRDSVWTAAVVRTNLAVLETVGVADRKQVTRAEFDLHVRRFAGTASAATAKEREPERSVQRRNDNSVSNSDFRFQNENENENEFQSSEHKEYIINNSRINKLINKPETVCFDLPEQEPPTVDDAVRNVDFSEPKVQRLRRKIARDLYEPGLHAGLVDRATAAVVARIASTNELAAAIRYAKEERRRAETTNGFRGNPIVWRSFAPFVKSWFDEAGYRWTPTDNRRERVPVPISADGETDGSADERLERLLAKDAERKRQIAERFKVKPGV